MDINICEQCSLRSEDYYLDEKGKLKSACDTCPLNPAYEEVEESNENKKGPKENKKHINR